MNERTNERMNERTNGLTFLPTNRSFVLFYPRPKAAVIDEVRQYEMDPATHAYKIIVGFFLTIVIQTRGFARKKIIFWAILSRQRGKKFQFGRNHVGFFRYYVGGSF